MEEAKRIDWSRADRHDTSDEAIREAIVGTLSHEQGAADVLARRFAERCIQKILTVLFGKYPDVSERDMQELVEDKVADVVLDVQAGKLTGFQKTPSAYLYVVCENEIKDRARKEKQQEVALGKIRQEKADTWGDLRATSTVAFVSTLSGRNPRPHKLAMGREMIRSLGSQVGRLPRRQREVIARRREGLEYDDIARELGIHVSTVRKHYDLAIDQLTQWVSPDGAVEASYLKRYPELATDPTHSLHHELLTGFLTSLSKECWTAFSEVHFMLKRVSEVAKTLGDCRASIEALLAYAYFAIKRKGGIVFPRDFLSTKILEPHPRYRDHLVNFTYW